MICRDVLNDHSRDARLIAWYMTVVMFYVRTNRRYADDYLEKLALKFYNFWKYILTRGYVCSIAIMICKKLIRIICKWSKSLLRKLHACFGNQFLMGYVSISYFETHLKTRITVQNQLQDFISQRSIVKKIWCVEYKNWLFSRVPLIISEASRDKTIFPKRLGIFLRQPDVGRLLDKTAVSSRIGKYRGNNNREESIGKSREKICSCIETGGK